jgi:hypothetical protein
LATVRRALRRVTILPDRRIDGLAQLAAIENARLLIYEGAPHGMCTTL